MFCLLFVQFVWVSIFCRVLLMCPLALLVLMMWKYQSMICVMGILGMEGNYDYKIDMLVSFSFVMV